MIGAGKEYPKFRADIFFVLDRIRWNWRRLFCRHPLLTITRWHKDTCNELHGQQAWVDHYNVYNFVTCCYCGKRLRAIQNAEDVYGTREPKSKPPQGCATVPLEPTEDMRDAGDMEQIAQLDRNEEGCGPIWRAMIAARPGEKHE